MAELQLIREEPVCDFVIDDILKEDEEISLDDTNPELQFTKFLYGIRHIQSEMEKMKINAENMIAEINSWLEKKLESKQKQIDYMCSLMKNYLSQKHLKSLTLPSGNIGFRKQPEKVEIVNADQFFEHATIDLIKVVPEKFEPDNRCFNKHFSIFLLNYLNQTYYNLLTLLIYLYHLIPQFLIPVLLFRYC